MGALFEIEHANFVAYLTTEGRATAPRAEGQTLGMFLWSLTSSDSLISSTKGTPKDWTKKVADAAQEQAFKVPSEAILTAEQVAQRLNPLRAYFTGYALYAMVLPSVFTSEDFLSPIWSEHDLESFRFFSEIAVTSHSDGLVLMPKMPMPGKQHVLTEVVDPFPALRALAETPVEPPAVVFWTRLQHPCVLGLKEAQQLYRGPILAALGQGLQAVDEVLESMVARRRRARRILHLSDLHFGSREAARRRSWLKEELAKELPEIDRVVVTGDLFDSPEEAQRESFNEFRFDVENMTGKDLLVIPGNHDVRSKGNAFGPLGRNAEYVTDLRWQPMVFDDDLRTAFFSFNSSETGNFAKGEVSEQQRLNRAVLFDREVRRRPEVADFLRIALVHHHPVAYGSKPTALYERILARLFGSEERFIAFDGAEVFMEWCGARGVSLILHGHKHVPHLATVPLPRPIGPKPIEESGNTQEIMVVGCGSSVGMNDRPMCYDIVTWNPDTQRSNVLFYSDEKGDGSGFLPHDVRFDLRSSATRP